MSNNINFSENDCVELDGLLIDKTRTVDVLAHCLRVGGYLWLDLSILTHAVNCVIERILRIVFSKHVKVFSSL